MSEPHKTPEELIVELEKEITEHKRIATKLSRALDAAHNDITVLSMQKVEDVAERFGIKDDETKNLLKVTNVLADKAEEYRALYRIDIDHDDRDKKGLLEDIESNLWDLNYCLNINQRALALDALQRIRSKALDMIALICRDEYGEREVKQLILERQKRIHR